MGERVIWATFHDRLAEAEAFAGETAASRETEVLKRGDIAVAGSAPPEFDDVAFAEERVLKAFTRNIRILANLPQDVVDLADEARCLARDDRHAALEASFQVALALSRIEGDPAVEALLSAAKAPLPQAGFFRRNAVFRHEDDMALDSFHFLPKP